MKYSVELFEDVRSPNYVLNNAGVLQWAYNSEKGFKFIINADEFSISYEDPADGDTVHTVSVEEYSNDEEQLKAVHITTLNDFKDEDNSYHIDIYVAYLTLEGEIRGLAKLIEGELIEYNVDSETAQGAIEYIISMLGMADGLLELSTCPTFNIHDTEHNLRYLIPNDEPVFEDTPRDHYRLLLENGALDDKAIAQ